MIYKLYNNLDKVTIGLDWYGLDGIGLHRIGLTIDDIEIKL